MSPLNLVLIGPPGSGKGTQAVRLARRYGVPHISTGDILRQAVRDDTPLGLQVAATIASGSLVGDELISSLVAERLSRRDTEQGFLLDGFPRTLNQASVLEKLRDELTVVHIAASDEAIVKRLSNRRICQSCALTQSVSGAGNSEDCPYCGGQLVRREDDDPDTVRKRLATYAALTGPLLEFYSRGPRYIAVDGLQLLDKVTADLYAALDALR